MHRILLKLKSLLFNVGKCECLRTGPGNTAMNYEMGVTIHTIHLRRLRD